MSGSGGEPEWSEALLLDRFVANQRGCADYPKLRICGEQVH